MSIPPDVASDPGHTKHDLAHQMATVRALVDTASDADLADADRARVLAAAQAELAHAADLVAALGPGQPTGRSTAATDLASVIEVAAATHHSSRVQTRTAGPAFVHLDRTDTLRVVRNLLGNALAASGPRGRVLLALVVPGDGIVRLDVHDDGPGAVPGGFARVGGKGLDIVRSLVLPAGGWLVLGRSYLGGALATVVLPGPTGGAR